MVIPNDTHQIWSHLQEIQDEFAAAFHMPIMLVDASSIPVIKPFRWMSECPLGEEMGHSSIPPEILQRHVESMVLACREFSDTAISESPRSGYVTMALPFWVEGYFWGAWIVECIQSVIRENNISHKEMILWLKRESHDLAIFFEVSA